MIASAATVGTFDQNLSLRIGTSRMLRMRA